MESYTDSLSNVWIGDIHLSEQETRKVHKLNIKEEINPHLKIAFRIDIHSLGHVNSRVWRHKQIGNKSLGAILIYEFYSATSKAVLSILKIWDNRKLRL